MPDDAGSADALSRSHMPGDGPLSVAYRTVALTGDEVPGTDGLTFAWLTENLFGSSPARIGREGTISFGGGWTAEFPFPHAILRDRFGTLETIAATGDSASGVEATWEGFPQLVPGAPRVSGDLYSFDGTVFTYRQQDGVWARRGGPIARIFLDDDQPPGTESGAQWFQWFHTLRGPGHIVVFGRYSTSGLSHINQSGFWRDDEGTLEVVALGGEPAPGTGAVFGNGTVLAMLPFQTWDLDSDGQIAFNAMLMGGDVNGWLNDEGIWFETEDGLDLLVREGDSAPQVAPDAVFRGLEGFLTFGSSQVNPVVRNQSDMLVFGAHVDVPSEVDYPYTSIWTNRSGELEVLAKGRRPDDGGPGGDHPPGFPAGSYFDDFLIGRLDELGNVAFTATAVGNGAGFGLWLDRGAGPEFILRDGDPVPGFPDVVDFGAPFPLSMHASGLLFFSASMTGGFGTGLFAATYDGEIQALVFRGMLFELAPGDSRVVNALSPGVGMSDEGELVCAVEFTDGSMAVVAVHAERPVSGVLDPRDSAGRLEGAIRSLSVTPNPFSSRTEIGFELASRRTITLGLYDVAGRFLGSLVDDVMESGFHTVSWSGSAAGQARWGGASVGSSGTSGTGVYFVRLSDGKQTAVRKLLRVR